MIPKSFIMDDPMKKQDSWVPEGWVRRGNCLIRIEDDARISITNNAPGIYLSENPDIPKLINKMSENYGTLSAGAERLQLAIEQLASAFKFSKLPVEGISQKKLQAANVFKRLMKACKNRCSVFIHGFDPY